MADRKWATQIREEELAEPTTLPSRQMRGGVEDVQHFERSQDEQEQRRMSRMMRSFKAQKPKRSR